MRRSLTLFLIAAVFTAAPSALFAQDSTGAPVVSSSPAEKPVIASPNAKVAILDFFNLSNEEEYDQYETQWGRGIRRAAFAWKKFVVIPFPRIHSAIEELRIDDYFIAPEQTPELGRVLEADLFILGTFNVSNGVLASSVKLVDAKTGRQLDDETRFGSIDKPEEFLADLIDTAKVMLLGEDAEVDTPALPTGESRPAVQAPPAAPPPAPQQAPPAAPSTTTSDFDPFAPPAGPSALTAPPVAAPLAAPPPVIQAPPPSNPVAQPAPAAQPPVVSQPPTVDPWGPPTSPAPQPRPGSRTLPTDAIEAQIPPLKPPTSDQPAQLSSPFQPMPVLPAPPPSRQMFAPPQPMPQPGLQQPPMGPIAQGPQQPGGFGAQPLGPQEVMTEEPSPVRRFFSAISRPFRPAPETVTPPAVAPQGPALAPQPPPPGTQMQPAAPPAEEPAGNPVTRFFGRMFGRGE